MNNFISLTIVDVANQSCNQLIFCQNAGSAQSTKLDPGQMDQISKQTTYTDPRVAGWLVADSTKCCAFVEIT